MIGGDTARIVQVTPFMDAYDVVIERPTGLTATFHVRGNVQVLRYADAMAMRAPNLRENVSASDAYARGRSDVDACALLRPVEIRNAISSWTAAQADHGHTSFYGAAHVRAMRAYWLGVARLSRETVEPGSARAVEWSRLAIAAAIRRERVGAQTRVSHWS